MPFARYSRDKLVAEWEAEAEIDFIFLPFDATLRRTTGGANFGLFRGFHMLFAALMRDSCCL